MILKKRLVGWATLIACFTFKVNRKNIVFLKYEIIWYMQKDTISLKHLTTSCRVPLSKDYGGGIKKWPMLYLSYLYQGSSPQKGHFVYPSQPFLLRQKMAAKNHISIFLVSVLKFTSKWSSVHVDQLCWNKLFCHIKCCWAISFVNKITFLFTVQNPELRFLWYAPLWNLQLLRFHLSPFPASALW